MGQTDRWTLQTKRDGKTGIQKKRSKSARYNDRQKKGRAEGRMAKWPTIRLRTSQNTHTLFFTKKVSTKSSNHSAKFSTFFLSKLRRDYLLLARAVRCNEPEWAKKRPTGHTCTSISQGGLADKETDRRTNALRVKRTERRKVKIAKGEKNR